MDKEQLKSFVSKKYNKLYIFMGIFFKRESNFQRKHVPVNTATNRVALLDSHTNDACQSIKQNVKTDGDFQQKIRPINLTLHLLCYFLLSTSFILTLIVYFSLTNSKKCLTLPK